MFAKKGSSGIIVGKTLGFLVPSLLDFIDGLLLVM